MYQKQYLRQSRGLGMTSFSFSPTKLYSTCNAQLSCHSSLNMPWPAWPGHLLPGPPDPLLRTSRTVLYSPSMHSPFLSRPLWACPPLCAWVCPECLIPRMCGISVCWWKALVWGCTLEWQWWEWKGGVKCQMVKENALSTEARKKVLSWFSSYH